MLVHKLVIGASIVWCKMKGNKVVIDRGDPFLAPRAQTSFLLFRRANSHVQRTLGATRPQQRVAITKPETRHF